MKGSVIVSNKHTVYKLPDELPNDLRLMRLGKEKIPGKSQNILDIPFIKSSDGQAIILSILLTCRTSALI